MGVILPPVSVAGFFRAWYGGRMDVAVYLMLFFWTLPFWLPVVWMAFAIGRRQASSSAILWLMTGEAIAIWLSIQVPGILTRYWPEP